MKRSMLLLPMVAFNFVAHAAEPAKTAPKGDPAKGQPIASTVCGACHGPDGNSATAANPKLAGQHADYLFKQMRNFKGMDGQPPERTNAVMNGMIAAYDEAQMRNLAAYFAAQKQTGEQAKNRETLELGQKLFRAGDMSKGLPACAACHGPAGTGIPAQYPRIAGQFAEYLEAQMKAFRAAGSDPKDPNGRANDPNKMMRMVAVKMTDAEIKAVADYTAGLR